MAIVQTNAFARIADTVNSGGIVGTTPLNIGTPSGVERALVLAFAGESNGDLFGDLTYCRLTSDVNNTTVLATVAPVVAWRGQADDRAAAIAVFNEVDVAAIAGTNVYIHIDGTESARLSVNWSTFANVHQTTPISDSAVSPTLQTQRDNVSVTIAALDAGSYVIAMGLHSDPAADPAMDWTTGATRPYVPYTEYNTASALVGELANQSGSHQVRWQWNGNNSVAPPLVALGLRESPSVVAPTITSVTADAGAPPTDVTLPAGAEAVVANANGGTVWGSIWLQSSPPTTHAQIVAGSGISAVQTRTPDSDTYTATFSEFAGLTGAEDYALYVTAENVGALPVPDGQAGFDNFTTMQPALSVIIPLINVENGSAWPDGRTVFYKIWEATDYGTANSAAVVFDHTTGVQTAGGGVITINALGLTLGDPTFSVLWEEEGTTAGFSPDDFFGVSRQNSVVNALVDKAGHANYVESPNSSGNWVRTREYIIEKETLAKTKVTVASLDPGTLFTLEFAFSVLPEMLSVELWRALGKGPPETAQSVTLTSENILEVRFLKNYAPGNNAVLKFRGVKLAGRRSIPPSTWQMRMRGVRRRG